MTDHIPTDIYRQCVAIAKSYYAMLRRRREQDEIILHGSPLHDGQPKANGVGDPTARKAERVAWRILRDWVMAQMAILETEMVAIDQIMLPYMVDDQGHTVYELYQSRQLMLGDGGVQNG